MIQEGDPPGVERWGVGWCLGGDGHGGEGDCGSEATGGRTRQ